MSATVTKETAAPAGAKSQKPYKGAVVYLWKGYSTVTSAGPGINTVKTTLSAEPSMLMQFNPASKCWHLNMFGIGGVGIEIMMNIPHSAEPKMGHWSWKDEVPPEYLEG